MKSIKNYLILFVTLMCLTSSGCGGWLGKVVDTVLDVATCLCEVVASEQPPGELGGMTPQEWCTVQKNVEPFIRHVTDAKAAASKEAGLANESD